MYRLRCSPPGGLSELRWRTGAATPKDGRMKSLVVGFILIIMAPTGMAAQASATEPERAGTVVRLGQLEWRESPSGLASAVVEGDPSVSDEPYTLALKVRDGAWIPPHWHPRSKRILVVSGTVLLGWGDTLDESSVRRLGAGDFALVPASARHYEGASGETVFMLYGIGPLRTTFVNR